MRLLLPPPLLLAAVVGAASPHHSPRAWPNVLDERDTWLFDHGSNFGWRALETRGGQHALVGPAPDWSLGNRAVPSLEVDVLLGDGPASVAAADEAAGGSFAAVPCNASSATQLWTLSPGVKPGDSKTTNIQMAAAVAGGKGGGCWEIEACATGEGAAVNCNWGCKGLPKSCASLCDCNGAWSLNSNGTITSLMVSIYSPSPPNRT
jgi:hypothetical protein